jgi:hypothetical protein
MGWTNNQGQKAEIPWAFQTRPTRRDIMACVPSTLVLQSIRTGRFAPCGFEYFRNFCNDLWY